MCHGIVCKGNGDSGTQGSIEGTEWTFSSKSPTVPYDDSFHDFTPQKE